MIYNHYLIRSGVCVCVCVCECLREDNVELGWPYSKAFSE